MTANQIREEIQNEYANYCVNKSPDYYDYENAKISYRFV